MPVLGATDYMHLFGLVALGHMWARMATVAGGEDRGGGGALNGRPISSPAAPSWSALPETALRLARITAGADTLCHAGGGLLTANSSSKPESRSATSSQSAYIL